MTGVVRGMFWCKQCRRSVMEWRGTAAMATCCIIYISLNTVMEGTFALRLETACMLWIRLKMPPAILAIAAQCLSSAYRNKQTRRRTAK